MLSPYGYMRHINGSEYGLVAGTTTAALLLATNMEEKNEMLRVIIIKTLDCDDGRQTAAASYCDPTIG
ncbi:unnamed protein product [Ceratitis capitata]|uniref:(Mediterranean fruit fly) hypothetical protein n=1 Tax=Ceratitis capitata TaxID=7213 RepID=A0A811UMZ6_CERCA|nr:unnamed protein product [Ceratitis capitata]